MNQKNIDKLVTEVLGIEVEEAKEAGALGYMARALVQATMPHSNPGDVEAWSRENGAFSMIMQPGIIKKNGVLTRIGLPYGSLPRLLLAWVTTEAVKKKTPRLVLGSTLSSFMNQLGLVSSGGRWGTITMLREQMKRLFSASIFCYYNKNFDNQGLELARAGFNITKSYQLWWDPKQPNQATLWESEVILSHDFYDEILSCPIPIDMRVLKAIKRSPMALDIYCWLTYRMSYLKHSTQIPWIALQMQFGSSYANDAQGIRNFKKAFLRELNKVKQFYINVNVEPEEHSLMLRPSFSHIPKQPKNFSQHMEKQIEKSKFENSKKQLCNNYTDYCYSQLLKIIETELEEHEKQLLLSQFNDYLKRNQVKSTNYYTLNDKTTHEWLYRFVKNNWHHLLEKITPLDEFIATTSS